jgi:hypothetical protein
MVLIAVGSLREAAGLPVHDMLLPEVRSTLGGHVDLLIVKNQELIGKRFGVLDEVY